MKSIIHHIEKFIFLFFCKVKQVQTQNFSIEKCTEPHFIKKKIKTAAITKYRVITPRGAAFHLCNKNQLVLTN